MRCCVVFIVAAAGLAAASGCGGAPSPAGPSPAGPSPGTSYASELALCIDLTNERRASVGRPGLTRSTDLETFAAVSARVDGLAHVAHQHWDATGGSTAENEAPWWPLSQFGSVRNVVTGAIDAFWSEGPGGGHYQNMTGRYTEIGCGIFVNGDEVTVCRFSKRRDPFLTTFSKPFPPLG